MAFSRKIGVELVADTSNLERGFSRAAKSATGFNRQVAGLRRSTRGVAVGFGLLNTQLLGAAGFGYAIKTSVDAASDLNEQISKTNVVFGRSAAGVKAWSKTTVDSMALSQRQALEVASSFGALLRPLGLTGQAAAAQSERLTQLGSDLASFYNTKVQDALDAIQSGLVGEQEPLRRYGALLSETRVQQEALRETGKKHVSQLTGQEKVLARIALIFKDTKKAQGDFERTQGGLANQTRKLSANIDQLKTNLGRDLLPVVLDVTKAMNNFFDAFKGPAPDQLTRGTRLETSLVPDLAKTIRKLQAHGDPNSLILQVLRLRVGDSGKASDLIAEAFRFARGDPKLKAEIAASAKKLAKTANDEIHHAVTEQARRDPVQLNQWFDTRVGRELDRVQDLGLRSQLARLKAIAQEVRDRLALTHDVTRRLTLEDQLVGIMRQQRGVQSDITDQIRAQNQALQDRADAIKSAVIDRLQGRQQARDDAKAVKDARDNLRLYKSVGGKGGIAEAQAALQQALTTQQIDRLSGMQPKLRRLPGGQQELAFGGVTININGITDPDAVAAKVVQVLRRKQRHTSTQQRGPGSAAGGAPR